MIRLGTFAVDCTPPVGSSVDFGLGEPTSGVRDPLYLRGFILDDGLTRCLVATTDFTGLMNSAYDQLREALGKAIGIPAQQVVIHSVHQHDAPLVDFEVEALIGRTTFPRAWWEETVTSCAKAAAHSAEHLVSVGSVGHAETRLFGYASNRRIRGADGTVRAMRFSRCADPALRAEPVGVIDPMLRTVAFRDGNGRLSASLSFYATHPQVSNGRNLFSADAPGEALRLVAEPDPDTALHAFFTGAGGNVTAGKYSDPTDLERNLLHFGAILARGISRNLRCMEWEDDPSLRWTNASFRFPRSEAKYRQAQQALTAESSAPGSRMIAAAVLSAMDYPANRSYALSLLRVGSASLLFLPGEPFVEYQLMAQAFIPDRFLAVAANCSDNFLYLPLAAHFAEGGYEVESYCWTTPQFEQRFRDTLQPLLAEE